MIKHNHNLIVINRQFEIIDSSSIFGQKPIGWHHPRLAHIRDTVMGGCCALDPFK
jgi:hypothetical protein